MSEPRERPRPARETLVFLLLVLAPLVAYLLLEPTPLVSRGDAFYGIMPLQVIGLRETLEGSFFWTDRLGLGYPLQNELDFQQANPLNLLYLVLEPVRAFHVQVVIWIGLGVLASWLCFRRLFPRFGAIEGLVYLALAFGAGSFFAAAVYQTIFLSSFAILPLVWLEIRRYLERGRARDLLLIAASLFLLIHTQYNFTLVPNLAAAALIVLFELGERSRRRLGRALALGLVIGGLAALHLADALEILALSNRTSDVTLAPLAPARLARSALALARACEPAVPRWALPLIAGGLAAHALACARRGWARFEGKLLALAAAQAAVGVALFESPRYLSRFAILVGIFFALWVALALGPVVRAAASLLDPEPRTGRSARLVFLASTIALFQLLASHVPEPAQASARRTEDVASYLRALVPGIEAGDRVALVVPDDFRYERDQLERPPYQPTQAALYGFREVGYYGSYLINGARLERTWEQTLSIQRFAPFGIGDFENKTANYNALTERGTHEPLLRLLSVEHLITPLALDSPLVTLVRTVPARGTGFLDQNLYRVNGALPRAWVLPLAPELAARLETTNDAEARALVEALIERGLGDGSLERALRPLAFVLSGRQLVLEGKDALAGPALAFAAMNAWPAWRADQEGARVLHPFGLTALVVRDARAPLALTFWPGTAPWKIAGLALVVIAFAIARRVRENAP